MSDSGLILPPGFGAARKSSVEALDRSEILLIQQMHALCQRHDIGIFCARCRAMFQGKNAPQDKYLVIECKCRELKADNPDRRVLDS